MQYEERRPSLHEVEEEAEVSEVESTSKRRSESRESTCDKYYVEDQTTELTSEEMNDKLEATMKRGRELLNRYYKQRGKSFDREIK